MSLLKSVLDKLPAWVKNNEFYEVVLKCSSAEGPQEAHNTTLKTPDKANVISSVAFRDNDEVYHFPLLDLDVEHAFIPSSTPGHNHLYINKLLTQEQYMTLIKALNAAGIVQDGIVKQMELNGCTTLRLPHIKKGGKVEEKVSQEYKKVELPEPSELDWQQLTSVPAFASKFKLGLLDEKLKHLENEIKIIKMSLLPKADMSTVVDEIGKLKQAIYKLEKEGKDVKD